MKCIRQILRSQFLASLSSDVRFYSICNISAHEAQNNNENALKAENKESPYYFEDGLRKVYPFYYRFNTNCKGRWINRKIIDVFCEEYALYSREEMKKRITTKLVTVNDKDVDINYVLKNNDVLTGTIHRHELPVLACPIEILFESDDLLVIDKPPSMPVHPCGLYYNNSIVFILANEYNRHDIYVTYRLDRLTSGVLLLAKSSEKARALHKEISMHNVKKEYICRVEGNFPEGIIVCNKPVKYFYHKIGACLVHPEGKLATTEFKKLSYNGKSSVVLCKPYTGRTHQIRVHLQYLGYPVVNDPVYNNYIFGPHKGKNGVMGKSVTDLLKDLVEEKTSEWNLTEVPRLTTISNPNENSYLKFTVFKEYYCMNKELPAYKKDSSKILYNENCYFCNTRNQNPEQLSLGIFLHAYKYQGDNWEFQTKLPFWASEDWNIA